ncbi:MAG: hypothetical protein J6R42_04085 [Clostridia bacterium]|nr:hypothetical protein [Clostridia bacterium]
MKHPYISLLYPSEDAFKQHAESTHSVATHDVCEALGFSQMLGLKNGCISQFLTCDKEVIFFRQQTICDVLKCPEVEETLRLLLPILSDIEELRKLGEDIEQNSGEAYLYSITEIELYTSCIDTLYRGLSPVCDKLVSPAFKNLLQFVTELVESEDYKKLSSELKKLSSKMHEVRSVTIGVNLDGQFRPTEAGVLSINAEPFHSGTALDKILRMSFRHDAMTCIAPLTAFGKGQTDNRKEALLGAFNAAILDVFHASVKGWKRMVGIYVLDHTDFLLRMLPEIEFICRAVALERRLMEKGYVMTTPTLYPTEDKVFRAKGLYNPDVALRIDNKMVANDFAFEDNTTIFVITGPNRGGKSVHTVAVGLAQCMAQLGMMVPAESADISPCDRILTHFPDGAEDTIDKGRLGEECSRLRQIFDEMTEHSLLLLDESLSSTGAFEATYIASDILLGFGLAKVRCIFSTHLHDLAAKVPEISQSSLSQGGVGMGTLIAEMNGDGSRSFRVRAGTPDGKSYASDIAKKYGLSTEEIMAMVHRTQDS